MSNEDMCGHGDTIKNVITYLMFKDCLGMQAVMISMNFADQFDAEQLTSFTGLVKIYILVPTNYS